MLSAGTLSPNQLEAAPPANMMYTSDSRTVRAVQHALRQCHYYSGDVDGWFGLATGIAIQRFQVDHGVSVKGIIDRPLLLALGITDH